MNEQKEQKLNIVDDSLEYPDFRKLDRSKFRKLPKDTILVISKLHFLIYIIALVISLVLIVPYGFVSQSEWHSISMSVGASGIGAVLLGYFIELAAKCAERKKTIFSYNDSILMIYRYLWEIFANRSYDYMKLIDPTNGQALIAKQSAEKFITQINVVIPQIDSFIFNYGGLFDKDTAEFYMNLRSRLIQFKASLQTPANTDHLIDLLNSVRTDLRSRFELTTIEKQMFRP